MSPKAIRGILPLSLVLGLAACSPSSTPSAFQQITYPDDAQISLALDRQLADNPQSTAVQDLVRTLGGPQGKLRYQIKRVIFRQNAYEVHYDAALVMGQAGTQSLQTIYAQMIPESERAKLTGATLDTYEQWLNQHAESLKKDPAQRVQGEILAESVSMLGKCYRQAQPDNEIVVMQGLAAMLLPEREGMYAEKLLVPHTSVSCLPL